MSKRHKSLAEQVAELETAPPKDFDPEALEDHDAASNDSEPNENSDAGVQARTHYVAVEKSKLRSKDVATLGPQYKGARVRRKEAFDEDSDDPFGRGDWDDEQSGDEDERMSGGGRLSDRRTNGNGEDELSKSNEEVFGSNGEGDESEATLEGLDEGRGGGPQEDEEVDRAELRRIMINEQKTVAASISDAAKADVDKGKAVKSQRSTFDALLNVRIRLQKSLIATNSLAATRSDDSNIRDNDDIVKATELAAFSLWTSLNDLRATLDGTLAGTKRKRSVLTEESTTEELWSQMQSYEARQRPQREAILNKWSDRSRSASAVLASSKGRLTNTAEQQLSDVLSAQLLDSSHLVKRAQVARSCAPVQVKAGIHDSTDIYDDADFYGLLLKELLEQRSSSSVATGIGSEFTVNAPWQAMRDAKTKKVVDTKASKGRKLRYTVHEKLQNFMAPEDRGTWGERQVDELFGSLFGRKMGLGEDDGQDEGSDSEDLNGIGPEERGLMLFRS